MGITDELAASLRAAVSGAIGAVDETIAYEVLAQNHETSVLTLDADETHIALVEAQAANPTEDLKVRQLRDIARLRLLHAALRDRGRRPARRAQDERHVEHAAIIRHPPDRVRR